MNLTVSVIWPFWKSCIVIYQRRLSRDCPIYPRLIQFDMTISEFDHTCVGVIQTQPTYSHTIIPLIQALTNSLEINEYRRYL